MIEYVAIASSRYGTIDPPERLPDAEQWRVTKSAEISDQVDCAVSRYRAMRHYQRERDPGTYFLPEHAEDGDRLMELSSTIGNRARIA